MDVEVRLIDDSKVSDINADPEADEVCFIFQG